MKKRKKLLIGFAAVIVLGAVWSLGMRFYYQHKFNQRVAELKAQGFPVSLADLEKAYVLPEGVPNDGGDGSELEGQSRLSHHGQAEFSRATRQHYSVGVGQPCFHSAGTFTDTLGTETGGILLNLDKNLTIQD